jgi:dihydroflavonol-4-reductase
MAALMASPGETDPDEPGPPAAFWRGKPVTVTGGSGFLGYQLLCRLVERGARVRCLSLPPPASHPLLGLKSVQPHFGDVRDPALARGALAGSEVVFHAAGPVAAWGRGSEELREVHLSGTRNVLEWAEPSSRIVHTSSVVAVGGSSGELLDEERPWNLASLRVGYVQAKRAAEELALQAAAAGREVVVVNPAFLVGPEDFGPSVMGRFLLRFWRGRIPLAPPGGLNLVDVRDAAEGHLLAAERGQSGRRYILGGENLSFADLFRLLSEVGGLSPRRLAGLPRGLWWLAAAAAEARGALRGREPYPSFQHVRLHRYRWFYDSSRAREELGFSPRPLRESLEEGFRWHRGRHGLRLTGLRHFWMRPRMDLSA